MDAPFFNRFTSVIERPEPVLVQAFVAAADFNCALLGLLKVFRHWKAASVFVNLIDYLEQLFPAPMVSDLSRRPFVALCRNGFAVFRGFLGCFFLRNAIHLFGDNPLVMFFCRACVGEFNFRCHLPFGSDFEQIGQFKEL